MSVGCTSQVANTGATLSRVPELPLRYIAGDPSLDFVNTIDWTREGTRDERLTSYDRLTRWAEGAGLLSADVTAELRAAARRQPRRATAALTDARRVRALLQRLLSASASRKIDETDLRAFNELLREAAARRRLIAARGRQPQWSWHEPQQSLQSPLWPVVWSAAELLASDEAEAVRVCPGPSCGWMFIDRSRNGLRRWCSMQTCGTREKTRRRSVRPAH